MDGAPSSVDSGTVAWSTLTIDEVIPEWLPAGAPTPIRDVIGLNPSRFIDQTLANPHLQHTDDGRWLIMAYGDGSLGDTAVGDAIYVVARAPDGSYALPSQQALAFPPAPAGSDWTSVGGLGAGSAFARSTRATSAGYRYFAAVPVGVFTTPQLGWVSWAVSADGLTWQFVNDSRNGLTDDPTQSLKLLRGSTLSNSYWHVAMADDPAAADNAFTERFYIAQGYSGACGIKATWWRIHFDPTNPWGLGEIERYQDDVYVPSDGLLPDDGDLWQCRAQDPKISAADGNVGPADPMDLVAVERADGSFDSMLFVYQPEAEFGTMPTPIYYVRGTHPASAASNFVWTTPRPLSTGPLQAMQAPGPFSACGAGGGYYLGAIQSGSQADGRPRLFGYVSTWPEGTTTPSQGHSYGGPCSSQPQGLLAIRFRLEP